MRFEKPQVVDDVTMICGCDMSDLLPAMADIPAEFHDWNHPWQKFAAKLFYEGGRLPATKPGIHPKTARRHLRAVLASFEPKHEHKMAGAAYLMSLWYERPAATGATS